jgi:FtsH-binding integral membrane protein
MQLMCCTLRWPEHQLFSKCGDLAMNSADYQANTPYASFGSVAIDAPASERKAFIRRTYVHLMAAIYGLVALEFVYFQFLPLDNWVPTLFSQRWGWLALFGGYMLISYIAQSWAQSGASVEKQYGGLLTYVFAFSVILCPLLWIANHFAMQIGGQSVSPILVAAVATLVVFGVLTATVFLTGSDFSFLGPILGISGLVLMGVIALGAFGLLNLGTGFCMLAVVFAAAAILYDTSNVLHHYRVEQHVAASLALFASVGLLFWYILQIVISLSDRR